MNAFDVELFVAQMDRMGVKLTVVPLADGSVRVNRWRTMSAVSMATGSSICGVRRSATTGPGWIPWRPI